MFARCHILVVGDVMLDEYTETRVNRISPEAPVPVAQVKRRWSVPGGAANAARNLACLGCDVTLVGVRADDATGNHLHELLVSQNINDRMEFISDRATPSKLRVVALGQQLLRLDDEDVKDFPDEVFERLWETIVHILPDVSVVVLSDYDKGVLRKDSSGNSLATKLIQYCKKIQIPVIVDPKGSDWDRYAHADCITPNTLELSIAAQVNADSLLVLSNGAVRLMQSYNLPRILLTRSEKGMALISSSGEINEIPTQAREVVDVSGAGDTVVAVLAICIANGMDWVASARIANIAAGVVVSKSGTSPIELIELEAAIKLSEFKLCGELYNVHSKIYSLENLKNAVTIWKKQNKKIVFTNGCFDLLHMGHVQLLHEAAAQGDKLIIGLNSDCSVKRLKGNSRPIQPQNARAVVLAALEKVDAVIIFDDDTPLNIIEELIPDVLVKGGDYTVSSVVGAEYVISHGGSVHIANFTNGYSTTNIVSRMIS